MDPSEALDQVATPTTLSILTLTRPILHPGSPPKRTSSGSASSDGDALRTPSAIQADLTHYQELFSKLRFSYVEQVTKERFLRAVTAEVPEFVSQGENAELEEKLKGDKEDLRRKKEEVRGLVAVLEEQGRGLAGREFAVLTSVWRSGLTRVLQVMRSSNSRRANSNPCPPRSKTSKPPSQPCRHRKRHSPLTHPCPYLCSLRSPYSPRRRLSCPTSTARSLL